MCTHQRFVTNPYTKTQFLAKCGKCDACKQEKAYKSAYRIKCEVAPDNIALFVTLTYDRCSCPFVLKSDVEKRLDILPVYREITTRRVRRHTSKGLQYLDKRKYNQVKLSDICFPDYDSLDYRSNLRSLAFRANNIGVCYYPDIQLFRKRLNINLKRIYNYDVPYKIYSCSEYGAKSQRPHFHLLVFIRPQDETLFRTAISQAWPFASHYRTEKFIEVARDAANYVASYVNSGSYVHGFLTSNFACKHSYSKDFGVRAKLFSFDSILEKVLRGDLSYLRGIGPKGKEQYFNFCIPKYVINRYFPLFKGYSRFTDVEVLDVLRSFIKQGNESIQTPLIDLSKLLSIDYDKSDLHKLSVRLSNSFANFCTYFKKLSPDFPLPSKEDYIFYYQRAWKAYKNTQLRLWYEECDNDPKYKYDNTQALRGGLLYSPDTLRYFDSSDSPYIDNPNEYPRNVKITSLYNQIFYFRCKQRKINNFVMTQQFYFI